MKVLFLRSRAKLFPTRLTGEALGVALLTLFFLASSLWRLGTLDFPSSNWKPHTPIESFYVDLGEEKQIDRAFLLIQDGGRVKVEAFCGSPGNWQPSGKLELWGSWREWKYTRLDCFSRYVRFSFENTTASLGELVLFSKGQPLAIKQLREAPPGAEALFDEPGYLTSPPTNQQTAYFDEIYFVRTAEEHLKAQNPFEWTHPPLGKLLIALGIAIFGAVPFGWRIVQVIAAATAIPVIFLLGKNLFGKRAGLLAAFILTFELMHFTEARLGTAESFIFLFVLLMFYFFYRAIAEENIKKFPLFLSLVFFGFGLATKWVALYGFFGMLILLGYLKWRQRRVLWGEVATFFLGGLAVLAIYLLSYIPYMRAGHSLGDVFRLQLSMYRYHSGLKAAHPFQSPWWSWPLMLKPLWMYLGELDGSYSIIVLLGNPALWWAGVPFMVLTAAEFCSNRDFRLLFILVPFLVQWLSFPLTVPRITFIYHFFPNVLFMTLAASYWLDRWWRRKGVVLAYLALNVAFFIVLYPIASGLPIPQSLWGSFRRIIF